MHHAKLLRPFLDENKGRLDLVYLSPYSPELNLIECLREWLKESVINNVFSRCLKNCAQGQRIYWWY
ncbi:transposase [Oceanobacillus timonensis]|uniref:transposase n=1 Tax=Oceanobacillus timonensis TaxID=1926285 RepID=UPI0009BB9696